MCKTNKPTYLKTKNYEEIYVSNTTKLLEKIFRQEVDDIVMTCTNLVPLKQQTAEKM